MTSNCFVASSYAAFRTFQTYRCTKVRLGSGKVWQCHGRHSVSSGQPTLCTQRSVSGRELKSSSPSAMMGNLGGLEEVVLGVSCEAADELSVARRLSGKWSWSVAERREKLRAILPVSLLNFCQALRRVMTSVSRSWHSGRQHARSWARASAERRSIDHLASEAMR